MYYLITFNLCKHFSGHIGIEPFLDLTDIDYTQTVFRKGVVQALINTCVVAFA